MGWSFDLSGWQILPFKIPRSCCFLAILKVWWETGVVSVSMCLILPTLIAICKQYKLWYDLFLLYQCASRFPPQKSRESKFMGLFKGTMCLPQSTPKPQEDYLEISHDFLGKKSPGYMEANTLDVELARVLCLTHIRAPRLILRQFMVAKIPSNISVGTGGVGRKLQYSKIKNNVFFFLDAHRIPMYGIYVWYIYHYLPTFSIKESIKCRYISIHGWHGMAFVRFVGVFFLRLRSHGIHRHCLAPFGEYIFSNYQKQI